MLTRTLGRLNEGKKILSKCIPDRNDLFRIISIGRIDFNFLAIYCNTIYSDLTRVLQLEIMFEMSDFIKEFPFVENEVSIFFKLLDPQTHID